MPPPGPHGRRQRREGDRPRFVAGEAGEREHPADRQVGRGLRPCRGYSPTAVARHHTSSIATASVVSASSSGSVIGVACRYSTFGFSANTAAPATAAAGESVSSRTIHAIAPTATANAAIEIATADAPELVPRVDLHRQRVQQMGQRQPDRADLLPSWREAVDDAARDDEVAARVVMAEREAELVIVEGDERSGDSGHTRRAPTGRPRRGRRYNHLFILWAESRALGARACVDAGGARACAWSPSSIRRFSRFPRSPISSWSGW